MQEEKKKKEMKNYNSKNIHHNKRMSQEKVSSIIHRLYTKDINKRKENKTILKEIYTPTFTPNIYTKKENNIKKAKNKNENHPQTQRNKYYKEKKEDSDSENEKNMYKTIYEDKHNHEHNNKKLNENLYYDDYEEEEEEKKNGRYKKISNSQKHFKKVEKTKKSHKNTRFSDNEDEETERVVIENAFRNRLFKHKK